MEESFPCSLLLVLFFSSVFCPSLAAEDTIAAGQSINDTQTLVSAEGRFELGFFTAGVSRRRYLGIWYRKVARTVVWVANRQRPLPDSTGVLALLQNGTLLLRDATSSVYWSTDTVGGAAIPIARLQDDGNFVVLDAGSGNGGRYNWQSFDHPTDTMLPGVRIGADFRTGRTRNITSWRSPDDPAPGIFSFAIDPRGDPQLVVASGAEAVQWRAGPWVGERFAGIPQMKANNVFSYGFIFNENEVYFRFDVWNKSLPSRLVMNRSGVVQHYMWEEEGAYWRLLWQSPTDTCDKVGVCGHNAVCDASKSPMCSCLEGFRPRQQQQQQQQWEPGITAGGCVRGAPVDCSNGTDGFVNATGAKLPDTSVATMNRSMGFDDCRAACLGNCSCTAFSSGDGSGCITWFGDLLDVGLYASGGQDLYVRAAAAAAAGQGSKRAGSDKKKTKKMTLVATIVSTVSVVFFLLMWMCLRHHRRRGKRAAMTSSTVVQDINESYPYDQSGSRNDLELPTFHLSTIVAATESFSFRNRLGEGGYGPVYEGKLHNGQVVAVKRLSTNSGQGSKEFKSEVELVAKLQHTNLVRLLGCCIEAKEKILVYEFMPNGSLDKFIFDAVKGLELDWTKRFSIIEGIAQGLLYLHKYSRLRVIHRDLKASNILLDDEWNPKISDFGMARIFTWSDVQANTNRIVGTYGYMPPEYAMKGLFSVKSDVFSFGILLLEILSGKRNTSIHYFGLSLNLSGYAWKLWKEDRALELVDPSLANACSLVGISRCIHIALLCVQENPVDRPTMLDVVAMLSNESVGLHDPNKPAYYFERYITNEDMHYERGQSSINDATVSEIQAR